MLSTASTPAPIVVPTAFPMLDQQQETPIFMLSPVTPSSALAALDAAVPPLGAAAAAVPPPPPVGSAHAGGLVAATSSAPTSTSASLHASPRAIAAPAPASLSPSGHAARETPSPPRSPSLHSVGQLVGSAPEARRKLSFIHKIKESAKEAVAKASGHHHHHGTAANGTASSSGTRTRSPSGRGSPRSPASQSSTPPASPRLTPSQMHQQQQHVSYGGPLSPSMPMGYAHSDPGAGGGPPSPLLSPSGESMTHGASPPRAPTMERKNSFKEAMMSLKSRTLSLGRSKSGDHHGSANGKDGSSPSSSKDPSLLDKYGVCDKSYIGKGATAVVRLVHKPIMACDGTMEERVYAVKEFRRRRKNESEKEYIKKLTSEFCISSSLRHINVVETLDLIQDENQHWCEVMEYCSGGDLYSVIKGGKMSRAEIDCCFKQLIMGVSYLHDNGVAHRDIKPENLLMDDEGHLKITDFGVSTVFKICWENEAHMSEGICGSEPYIAPEEFDGQSYDAREVDVWACGIVYYAMVYSGIPWRHATKDDPNFAFYLKHRQRDFEAIDRLPEGCRDLMYKILEPNPKKRATIKDVVADPWFAAIDTCFEARDYGSDLPAGMDRRPTVAPSHSHYSGKPASSSSPPRSRANSSAAGHTTTSAAAAAASAAAALASAVPPIPPIPEDVPPVSAAAAAPAIIKRQVTADRLTAVAATPPVRPRSASATVLPTTAPCFALPHATAAAAAAAAASTGSANGRTHSLVDSASGASTRSLAGSSPPPPSAGLSASMAAGSMASVASIAPSESSMSMSTVIAPQPQQQQQKQEQPQHLHHLHHGHHGQATTSGSASSTSPPAAAAAAAGPEQPRTQRSGSASSTSQHHRSASPSGHAKGGLSKIEAAFKDLLHHM
ncbi:kinase-like domain-containing protein [Blastocladiella britannica]|nr:kinase-like domain-containing protein [Blastocladiella britannica]